MKIEAIIYNPKLVNLSYKIYEISAGLGLAVMPKLPSEYNIEQRLNKKLDDITKNLKDS